MHACTSLLPHVQKTRACDGAAGPQTTTYYEQQRRGRATASRELGLAAGRTAEPGLGDGQHVAWGLASALAVAGCGSCRFMRQEDGLWWSR